MANINEILARAAALRDETALNSIDPERAGGIMYDTLIALNELWLQTGSALVISKIYSSVSAMNADTNPVSDLTGQPLKPGQIVVIASSDSDNGTVYRYNGTSSPRWTACGTIGGVVPVDNLDSDSSVLPLAARQGKVLDYHSKAEAGRIIDFSGLTAWNGTIWSDVKEWGTNSGNGYMLSLEGVKKVIIQGSATHETYLAFCTNSSTPKGGSHIPVSSQNCLVIAVNQFVTTEVATDSKYLFISNTVGDYDCLPQIVSFVYDKAEASELAKEMQFGYTEKTVNIQGLGSVNVWPFGDIGKWDNSGNGYILDVSNAKMVSIKANSNRTSQIIGLVSNEGLVHNTSIVYSAVGNIVIPTGQTYDITISSDTKYLYIGNTISGNNYTPSEIVVTERVSNNKKVLNFNDGDNITSKLQRELDRGGDIVVEGNGYALISSTLIIKKSNTKLSLSRGTILKLADNVNAPLIETVLAQPVQNDQQVENLPKIQNIEICGGIWDLNSYNQTRASDWIAQTGFMLFDIESLNVHDMLIMNPITFTLLTGNIHNFTFRNIEIKLTNILLNNDGIHFAGACYNGLIENIKGNTNDDLVALNFGGDSHFVDPTDPSAGIVNSMYRVGGAYNIKVHNIFCDNAMRAVRVLCDNIHDYDRIDIDGIYGTCYENGVINISCWKQYPCHIKRLKISNIQCYLRATYMGQTGNGANPIIKIADESEQELGCTIDSLIIDNVQVDQTSYYKQNVINMEGNTTLIKNLVLSNVIMTTEQLNLSEHFIIKARDSKVINLLLSNIDVENCSDTVGEKLFGLFDGKSDYIMVSNSILNCDHTYYIWNTGCVIKESNVIHNGVEVLANNEYTSSIEYTASR